MVDFFVVFIFQRNKKDFWKGHTVHGSEILRSTVEVGSLSHYLQGLYIPGGAGFFCPSTVSLSQGLFGPVSEREWPVLLTIMDDRPKSDDTPRKLTFFSEKIVVG